MRTTLKQLAELVQGELKGDPDLPIEGFCSTEHPAPGRIAFAETAKSLSRSGASAPAALITTRELAQQLANAIISEHPRLAFVTVMEHFLAAESAAAEAGISPLASIHPEARLAGGATVGPYAVVEQGASIGAGSEIGAGCFIGRDAVIGECTRLYPRVVVLERCEIGSFCIVNSGTVIGSEGFGYVTTREGHRKFPQAGRVVIEDHVEIGANCTIDRAAIDETRIGRGCKLDNLVQIAHNVQIGEYTLIAAQCGIAGSTKVGPWCELGGQAGLQGGIEVGAGSRIAGQSGVFASLPPKSRVSGYPAKPHQQAMRVLALTFKLPELTEKIKALEDEVRRLRRSRRPRD